MSTRFSLLRKRPSTPFMPKAARQSDLHILGREREREMLHRGVRRAPNMTNDWLRSVFDCSAVCWHFTNGSECVFCRSDSSLLICRPTVHTNTGTHLHSNWSVAAFSPSDQETRRAPCVRLQFSLAWMQLSFRKVHLSNPSGTPGSKWLRYCNYWLSRAHFWCGLNFISRPPPPPSHTTTTSTPPPH